MTTLLLLATVAALLLASAGSAYAFPRFAVVGERDKEGIACRLGRTFEYDYNARFVDSATVVEVTQTQSNAAMMTADGLLAVTAVEAAAENCTFAVELTNVDVREIIGEEVVEQSDPAFVAELLAEPFYFVQAADGAVQEVLVDERAPLEVQTFQRGIANAFNVTMRSGSEAYTVLETDVSGTHYAHYTVTPGEASTLYSRTYDQDDFIEGPRIAATALGATHQASISAAYNPLFGMLQSVAIDEMFIITEPDAAAPPVSDFLRHATMAIEATVSVELTGTNAAANLPALRSGLQQENLIALALPTAIDAESGIVIDNSAVIADLFARLESNPSSPELLTLLVRALREDANGVAQVRDYVIANRPGGALAQTLSAGLVGDGSPAAQDALVALFLTDAAADAALVADVLVTASLLEAPSADVFAAVDAIRRDPANANALNAALVLGALAGNVVDTQPDLAATVADALERQLQAAGDAPEADVFMRALGNIGLDGSLPAIARYLDNADPVKRMTAVEALRKMPSADVHALLAARLDVEEDSTVRLAIAAVALERGDKDLFDRAGILGDPIIDESWEDTFGFDFAHVDLTADALVEINPVLIDLEAKAIADIVGNTFEVARAKLLSEETGGNSRRLYLNIRIMGNDVYTYDNTVICQHGNSGTLWNGTINLPTFQMPIFSIGGILNLSFILESSLEYDVTYGWQLDWCALSEITGFMELNPAANFHIDGYAQLSLLVVRGGVGAAGNLVDAELPARVDLTYSVTDGLEVCLDFDLVLILAEGEIYGWAQYWWWGWKPNPRPHWTLYSFTVFSDTFALFEQCWDAGGAIFHCIPDVTWWDGTTIDAWWDGANCFVKGGYPSSMGPFTQNNAYYIATTPTTNCPFGSTWNGTGCFVMTLPWGLYAPYVDNGILYITTGSGTCPPGTWPVEVGYPPEVFACGVTYVGSNGWYQIGQDLYLDSVETCSQGIMDNIGCWLGDAPLGKNPFHYNPTNAFYYQD